MSLPELNNWTSTRDSLHQAAQVIGAFRKNVVERQPNFQHLSLGVVPAGLSTGNTHVGEITLDFIEQAVIYDAGKQYKLLLAGLSQTLLRDNLVNALAQEGHVVSPDRQALSQTAPFEINAQQAKNYAHVLYIVHQALAAFALNLPGYKTPPVVWPHHFDLSFLWFAGEGKDERHDPHMNFGFSPYTEGIDGAYFYAYAWSEKTGYLDIPTPPKTQLILSGSKYTALRYEEMRHEDDPMTFIQQHFQQLWESTSPLLTA